MTIRKGKLFNGFIKEMNFSTMALIDYLKMSVFTSARKDAVTRGSSHRLSPSKFLTVIVIGSTSS